MKTEPELIKILNDRLVDELAAISQYIVHAEILFNYGYERMAKEEKARAIAEMKHAEMLIERIIFFEGSPAVSSLGPIRIASDVEQQLANDFAAETRAVAGYQQSIVIADRIDSNTRRLLEEILHDEMEHVNYIEARQSQIKQMGLSLFLGTLAD